MSSKRRAKFDIYSDVIEMIAKKGLCSLTLLSYGANLPVDRAKNVLQLLVSHGFVREVPVGKNRRYRATKRGIEFLKTYRKLEKFFEGLEQPVSMVADRATLPNRLPTGCQELDNVLLGGIPENYSVILTSPSCNERQVLIDNFLREGLKDGNLAIDIATELRRNMLKLAEENATNFHLFLCNPLANELVGSLSNVSKLKDVENLNEISITMGSAFRKLHLKPNEPKRICIETVSDVLLHHRALDTRRWLIGLTTDLKNKGFTILAVMNPYMHGHEEVQAILDLFEGEIDMYEKESEEGLRKYLKVRKLYDQDYMEFGVPIGRKSFAGGLRD